MLSRLCSLWPIAAVNASRRRHWYRGRGATEQSLATPQGVVTKLRRAGGGHQKKGPQQDRSRLDEETVSSSDDVEGWGTGRCLLRDAAVRPIREEVVL